MDSNEKLAQWAALFVNAVNDNELHASEGAGARATTPGIQYPGVTQAAGDLLRAVDAGGIPAFVTGKLKQIALDNGIEVAEGWTPNEVVEALRSMARDSVSG